MLRWYSVDYSDEANRSPLFLAAVELVEKTNPDGERHDYVIKPKVDGLRINPPYAKSSQPNVVLVSQLTTHCHSTR